MSPTLILGCVAAYFLCLLAIAWRTSRGAGEDSYFLGNRASPWYAVAFGLVGDSLSGVTFISVPGQVGTAKLSYLQIVFGYVLGYVVIAQVLLPLYYRLRLTSIYSYLGERYGIATQRTGSACFLFSRLTGAAARLYLAADVLQVFVFKGWGVPFWVSVSTIIVLILVYTYRGGIKTLVWTDTFQSTFLLLGLVLSVVAIAWELGLGPTRLVQAVTAGELSQVFFWDWRETNYFWKQFISGACIAVVMTGLDQNMMQKNLSCRSLREAQINIYSFTVVLVAVNWLFLALGILLHQFAVAKGIPIPAKTDQLFPMLALQHLGTFAAVVFVLGLTAATFSSADSVLTALTTSFCFDFLGWKEGGSGDARTRQRHWIHITFALLLLLVILGFNALNQRSVISAVLTLASYTYGPLLGLFVFGICTRARVRDRCVPVVAVSAPLLGYILQRNSEAWFNGYRIGFELLPMIGFITLIGLWVFRAPAEAVPRSNPQP